MSSNRKYRILIVEDSTISSYIVKRLVRASGFFEEPAIREDGRSALKYLEGAQRNHRFPDVIILDIQMPGMDGIEFLEWYENDFYENYPKTKIFIFSIENPSETQSKILRFNAVDSFISKYQDGSFLTTLLQRLALQ
ncbi:MAG: response regulator [Microscillaceae bacterium]|nr:response regulator [Microscillaceae bacterium]